MLGLAAPASAHDELVSSDPASGTAVDALPAQITLTFSGAVLADLDGNQVQVTDATGQALADGDPVVQDNVVSQPLAGAAEGAVAVVWRVVSADGHPVSGEFSFTVAGAVTPPATATPAASGSPAASPAGTAMPMPSATPTAAVSESSPVPWIVLGTALIAAVAGVVYLLVARGRRPSAPPADGQTDR